MDTCNARIGWAGREYGFAPVTCGQRIGLRCYQATTGEIVRYCAIPGHEANVRRQHAEAIPFSATDMTTVESWTDAGWTESEMREAFGG